MVAGCSKRILLGLLLSTLLITGCGNKKFEIDGDKGTHLTIKESGIPDNYQFTVSEGKLYLTLVGTTNINGDYLMCMEYIDSSGVTDDQKRTYEDSLTLFDSDFIGYKVNDFEYRAVGNITPYKSLSISVKGDKDDLITYCEYIKSLSTIEGKFY